LLMSPASPRSSGLSHDAATALIAFLFLPCFLLFRFVEASPPLAGASPANPVRSGRRRARCGSPHEVRSCVRRRSDACDDHPPPAHHLSEAKYPERMSNAPRRKNSPGLTWGTRITVVRNVGAMVPPRCRRGDRAGAARLRRPCLSRSFAPLRTSSDPDRKSSDRTAVGALHHLWPSFS
jgi:hypothetical protein